MIIKAKEEDIASIVELANLSWPITYKEILSAEQIEFMLNKFYSIEVLTQIFKEEKQLFLLYKNKEEKVLGFVSYELNYGKDNHLKIHKLYIHPNTQGMGIGSKLIDYVSNIGIENQQTSLSLNVNKYNSAVNFYEKVGLKKMKDEVINIGNGYIMDDYVMGKSL